MGNPSWNPKIPLDIDEWVLVRICTTEQIFGLLCRNKFNGVPRSNHPLQVLHVSGGDEFWAMALWCLVSSQDWRRQLIKLWFIYCSLRSRRFSSSIKIIFHNQMGIEKLCFVMLQAAFCGSIQLLTHDDSDISPLRNFSSFTIVVATFFFFSKHPRLGDFF